MPDLNGVELIIDIDPREGPVMKNSVECWYFMKLLRGEAVRTLWATQKTTLQKEERDLMMANARAVTLVAVAPQMATPAGWASN